MIRTSCALLWSAAAPPQGVRPPRALSALPAIGTTSGTKTLSTNSDGLRRA